MSLPISYLESVLRSDERAYHNPSDLDEIARLKGALAETVRDLEELENESKIKKQQSTDEKSIESKQRVERTKTENKRTTKSRSNNKKATNEVVQSSPLDSK